MTSWEDTISENTTKAAIHGYTILLGAGIGSYYQACISIAQIKVGKLKVFTAITFISASKLATFIATARPLPFKP